MSRPPWALSINGPIKKGGNHREKPAVALSPAARATYGGRARIAHSSREERPDRRHPQRRSRHLLLAWGHGDQSAFERLAPLVYDELKRLARRYMARERDGHTLQPTALVNEVYLKLVDVNRIQWQNRAHFFAMSARLMRRILVDFARARHARKRSTRRPEGSDR